MKMLRSLVPYSLLVMPMAGLSAACTPTWTNGDGNSVWNDSNNWSPTCVPGTAGNNDTALFNIVTDVDLRNSGVTPFHATLLGITVSGQNLGIESSVGGSLIFNTTLTATETFFKQSGTGVTTQIKAPINLGSAAFRVSVTEGQFSVLKPLTDTMGPATTLSFGKNTNTGGFTLNTDTGTNLSSIQGDFILNDFTNDNGEFDIRNDAFGSLNQHVSFTIGGNLHQINGGVNIANSSDLSSAAMNGTSIILSDNTKTLTVDNGFMQIGNSGQIETNTTSIGALLSVSGNSIFNNGVFEVSTENSTIAAQTSATNTGAAFETAGLTMHSGSGGSLLSISSSVTADNSIGTSLTCTTFNSDGGHLLLENTSLVTGSTQGSSIGCLFNATTSFSMSGDSSFVNSNFSGTNVQNNGTGVSVVSAGPVTLSGNAHLSFENHQALNNFSQTGLKLSAQSLSLTDNAVLDCENTNSTNMTGGNGFFGNILNPSTMNGGAITLTNTGNLNGAAGVTLVFDNTFTMNNGNISITNNGTISKAGASGFFGTDFIMNNGLITIANTNTISNLGTGSELRLDVFTQTGGVVNIMKSPAGTVDINNTGSLLEADTSITLSGTAIFQNDEFVYTPTLTVNPGATVKGSGTFSGFHTSPMTLFLNSGIVMPGNSPGVMTIIGPYQQTAQGELLISILNASAPGTGYSQLSVVGPASLNGTLGVEGEPGFVINTTDTFTILQSTDPRTGTFANVVNLNMPGLTPVVTYLPNSVLLSFLQSAPVCCCPRMCSYLSNYPQTVLASVNETNNFILKRQFQRIQTRNLDKGRGAYYVGPIGSVGHSDNHDDAVGFNYWSAGALAGADFADTDGGFGALATYERIDGNAHDDWGSFDVDHVRGSLYKSVITGPFHELSLDFALGYAYEWYHIRRETSSGTAKGTPQGYEFDGFLSFEYMLSKNQYPGMKENFVFTPMFNIQYIQLRVNEFTEHDSGFNDLTFEHRKLKSFTTVLGAFAEYTWKKLVSTVDLGWQREYLMHRRTLKFSKNCIEDCLEMPNVRRNTLLAGFDFLYPVTELGSIEAAYDLQWNQNFTSNRFYLAYNSQF